MDKFEVFRDEYGPLDAPRGTVHEEICRAWMRINDEFERGHKLGASSGDGGGYVNYAGRYLGEVCEDENVDHLIDALWGLDDDNLYRLGIIGLGQAVLKYLERNPQLADKMNKDDMWNYCEDDDFDGLWPKEEEEEEWPDRIWMLYNI